MSPTATRTSRTVKRTAKAAESKSASKKVVPTGRKAARAVPEPVGRAKPAAKAAKPAPKAEPKLKSKPVKVATPVKKSLMVDVEKPKKKTENATPEVKPEHAPKTKAAKSDGDGLAPKKALKAAAKPEKSEPFTDEEEAPKSGRGRKPKSESSDKPVREKAGRPSKAKPLDAIDEFLADDVPATDDIEEEDAIIPEDLSELDPLDLPLALLDPELVEVPRPVGPMRPKPKPRVERNPKQCAGCGGMFTWLSVDQLCFNCLKKKLAAKKREDEAYGGFTPEAEDDDSD